MFLKVNIIEKMRSKSHAPAPNKWAVSPEAVPNRRALAVKLNNFFVDNKAASEAEDGGGTWPREGHQTRRRRSKGRPRPLTATLERPKLLDINLLGKIDMSLMSKELFSIYQLMNVPLVAKKGTKEDEENSCPKSKKRLSKSSNALRGSLVDVASSKRQDALRSELSNYKRQDALKSFVSEVSTSRKQDLKPPVLVKVWNAPRKVDEAFCGRGDKLAPPCDSCGRSSRPERLHAHHGAGKLGGSPDSEDNLSAAGAGRRLQAISPLSPPRRSPLRQLTPPSPHKAQKRPKPAPLPPEAAQAADPLPGVPLPCQHCGRRFGSASLAIHEAKCREKLTSERAAQPDHMPKQSTNSQKHSGDSDPSSISPRRHVQNTNGAVMHSPRVPRSSSPSTGFRSSSPPVARSPRPVVRSPRPVASPKPSNQLRKPKSPTKHLTVNESEPKKHVNSPRLNSLNAKTSNLSCDEGVSGVRRKSDEFNSLPVVGSPQARAQFGAKSPLRGEANYTKNNSDQKGKVSTDVPKSGNDLRVGGTSSSMVMRSPVHVAGKTTMDSNLKRATKNAHNFENDTQIKTDVTNEKIVVRSPNRGGSLNSPRSNLVVRSPIHDSNANRNSNHLQVDSRFHSRNPVDGNANICVRSPRRHDDDNDVTGGSVRLVNRSPLPAKVTNRGPVLRTPLQSRMPSNLVSSNDVPLQPEPSPVRSKRQVVINDYVFKENGELDCEATFHSIWSSHLRSLVTCTNCGRNFAPERIQRHQEGCDGSSRRQTQPQ